MTADRYQERFAPLNAGGELLYDRATIFARLRQVSILRAYSGTLITFAVAICLAWSYRIFLVGIWASPLLALWPVVDHLEPLIMPQAGESTPLFQVALATAVLLTLPVFYGESWLLLCRRVRRASARRLVLPFSFASTCSAVLALWLVQHIDYPLMLAALNQ